MKIKIVSRISELPMTDIEYDSTRANRHLEQG